MIRLQLAKPSLMETRRTFPRFSNPRETSRHSLRIAAYRRSQDQKPAGPCSARVSAPRPQMRLIHLWLNPAQAFRLGRLSSGAFTMLDIQAHALLPIVLKVRCVNMGGAVSHGRNRRMGSQIQNGKQPGSEAAETVPRGPAHPSTFGAKKQPTLLDIFKAMIDACDGRTSEQNGLSALCHESAKYGDSLTATSSTNLIARALAGGWIAYAERDQHFVPISMPETYGEDNRLSHECVHLA
jgi:hypothetical protein